MNNDSAVHQIECTCHGSNPNCFKCGGWGYIDSVSANRLIDGPAEEAEKNGLGVFSLDGKMVDLPIINRAIHTLNIARLTGLID